MTITRSKTNPNEYIAQTSFSVWHIVREGKHWRATEEFRHRTLYARTLKQMGEHLHDM